MGHVRAFGFEQTFAATRQTGAKEDDARIDVRRMKGELSRPRRVDSNAGHLDPVAERLLKAYFHLQLSPDASRPNGDVGGAPSRTRTQRQAAYDRVRLNEMVLLVEPLLAGH